MVYWTVACHDDMIREQELMVVMLGTNDIKGSKGRRENSGSKVFTDLLEACDRITSRFNTPAAIVQVPPQSSPARDIEVAVLNARLETVQTETPLVIHTQDIRKTPKDKTLQKDGFHLTDTAGQKIAEAINTATEDLIKLAELKVHKIETDRDNAKFVIGRKGTRIESLRMKHNVTITTENMDRRHIICHVQKRSKLKTLENHQKTKQKPHSNHPYQVRANKENHN